MADTDRNYYDVLAVQPSVNKAQLDRAYLTQKTAAKLEAAALWELERAYATLSDADLKRKYDEVEAKRERKAEAAPRSVPTAAGDRSETAPLHLPAPLRSGAALCVGCLILVAVIILQLWPEVSIRLTHFEPGTKLVDRVTGEAVGEVLRYDSEHAFPGGIVAPAYLVRRTEAGREQWLPLLETNQSATAVPNR